jgi:hypothetical protein
MVTRKSALRDLAARRPTFQPATVVWIPGASTAERSAARRARHLPPLVQLLSNWGNLLISCRDGVEATLALR